MNIDCVFYRFKIGITDLKVHIMLCNQEDSSCGSDNKPIAIFRKVNNKDVLTAYGTVEINADKLMNPLSTMSMTFTPHEHTVWSLEFGKKETITVTVDDILSFTTEPIPKISDSFAGGKSHTHKKSPKPLRKNNNATATATWTSTGRKGTTKDGSMRVLFGHPAKPGELRVRTMRKGRDGKVKAVYVKFSGAKN